MDLNDLRPISRAYAAVLLRQRAELELRVLDVVRARREAYSVEVAADLDLALARAASLLRGLHARGLLTMRMAPGSRGLGRLYYRIAEVA